MPSEFEACSAALISPFVAAAFTKVIDAAGGTVSTVKLLAEDP